MMKRSFIVLVITTFLTLTIQAAQLPEKLRVLSCELPVQSQADLKTLIEKADPDVILLQGAIDWENCERICKFRPGMRVLTCSAFSEKSQAAILARDKAPLSWVEEISGGHGFAFAVIQAGQRKIGLFSVASDANSSAPATERVLVEVKKLRQFTNNRPDSFLIAGASLLKSSLVEGGFETVTPDGKASAEFWAANAGFLSRPRALTVAGIPNPVLVSDVDTVSSFSSKFAYQTALLLPGESGLPPVVPVQEAPTLRSLWPVAVIILGAFLVLFILFIFVTRRHSNALALVPMNQPGALNPAIDPSSRSHLVGWIKSMFVQRLLAQRQEMINTENEATRRTLAIEEKLTNLQTALQERINAYESRIQRLETELSAATFENRDLIRSQIELLKQEMAKAKEEFGYR